jgi:N-methylhydantoinase B
VVKEVELLGKARITLISERRQTAPYGLQGGGPGRTGRNLLLRDGRERELPAKSTIEGLPGDRLLIETPGGGGWGDRGEEGP